MNKHFFYLSFALLSASATNAQQYLLDGQYQRNLDLGVYTSFQAFTMKGDKMIMFASNPSSPLGWARQHNLDGTPEIFYGDTNTGIISTIFSKSSGKIIVGGSFSTYSGVGKSNVAQVLSGGTTDPSYPCGTNAPVYAIDTQSNGKVILAGGFSTFYWAGGPGAGVSVTQLVRTNVNGTHDNTFSMGTGFSNTSGAVVLSDVAVQPDDKILVAGLFTSYNGNSQRGLLRLNSDGTLDNTFNAGNSGVNNLTGVGSIHLLSNGQMYITGSFTSYNGVNNRYLARLNADGTLDNTFNVGTGSNSAGGNAITILNDGKLLVWGSFTQFNGVPCNKVVRLNTDGSIDSASPFGNSGFTGTPSGLKQISDGSILVFGSSYTAFNGATASTASRLAPCPSSGTPTNYTNPANLVNICANSTTVLEAAGMGKLAWFDAPNGGNLVATGNQFTTPNLSGTTTYYVQHDTACAITDRLPITIQVLPAASFTQNISICGGETYTYNGNVYSTTGTYTDVFSNGAASGCDSTVTTNLQVNLVDAAYSYDSTSFSATLTQAGIGYQWYNCVDGMLDAPISNAVGQTYTGAFNGANVAAIVNNNGCLDTTGCICFVDSTVNVNGSTLSGNYYDSQEVEFYWYDCQFRGGGPTVLGTGEFFTPTASGYYAFFNDGDWICYMDSKCIYFDILSSTITQTDATSGISISPNPAQNYCLFDGLQPNARLQLVDVTGRILGEQIANGTQLTWDTSLLNNGLYLVRIEQDGKLYTQKMVICK